MLKQRVIGALVLLALIIIFVPMLFNRQDDARKVAVEAPPQPAAPTVPATEVQPVQTPEAPPVVVVPDEPAKPLGKPQTPIAGTAGQTPTQNAPVTTAPAQSQPAAPVAKAPAASAPAAPKPDSRLGAANLPNSWSVQLASLSSRPSADALQAKLRSQGYNAYVRTADGMNRVFVGPVIERSEADRLRDQLNKQNGVKGFVVRFQPERG